MSVSAQVSVEEETSSEIQEEEILCEVVEEEEVQIPARKNSVIFVMQLGN